MTKRMCYSFEPSGHNFVPLDGTSDGIYIHRLYCTRCSRVVLTDPMHNFEGWDFASLPDNAKVDAMIGGLHIRKDS